MANYIGILEKEPTSLWGIWFPDLPGCITAAETSEACIVQASEALDLWLEDVFEAGEAPPRARAVEELLNDANVRQALSLGQIVVAVAPPGDMLGFDGSVLIAIDAAAARRGVTRLGFVREAVLEKIAG